jgi:hypothetical protein
MSVTIEAHIDADEFEFGRTIESVDGVRVELETIIPIGEQALPLIEIHDENHGAFVRELRERPAVASVVGVEEHDERGVYAVEWHEDPDTFFKSLRDQDAQILNAIRPNEHWEFEIRFPSREALSAFREQINQAERWIRSSIASRVQCGVFDHQRVDVVAAFTVVFDGQLGHLMTGGMFLGRRLPLALDAVVPEVLHTVDSVRTSLNSTVADQGRSPLASAHQPILEKESA